MLSINITEKLSRKDTWQKMVPKKKEIQCNSLKGIFVKNLCQICQIWRNFFWKTCAKFEENLANYCCGWSPLVATSHIIKLIKSFLKFFFNLNKNPILNHVLNILKKKKKKKKSTLVFLYAQNWLRVLISWRFVQAEQNRTEQLPKVCCSRSVAANW